MMNPKEILNVVKLQPAQRLHHFVWKVIGARTVWSLANEEGWVLASDPAGVELVPIWPASEYAALCAVNQWSDCVPREIPLEVFLDKWIPGMKSDGRRCEVFPTVASDGFVIEPDELHVRISDALASVEYVDD